MKLPSYALACLLIVVICDLSTSTPSELRWKEFYNNSYADSGQAQLCSDYTKEGYVNMGGLHSFTSDLSGSIKQDVLYSTLLAQITASSRYGRTDQFNQWYDEYVAILKSVGWKIESFTFSNYSPASLTYSIFEAVKEVVMPRCLDVQKKVALELLEAYRTLVDDDEKVDTFVKNACHDLSGDAYKMAGNFQVLPAVADSTGSAVTVFGSFYFEAVVKVHRFLWFTWKTTDIYLKSAIQIGTLEDDHYSAHRSSVANKLGSKIKDFIKEVPL